MPHSYYARTPRAYIKNRPISMTKVPATYKLIFALVQTTTATYKCYRCNLCGVTKPQRTQMVSHFRHRHSELRPYKCHICQKSFKRSFTLASHLRSQHDPDRPVYSCDKCTFSTINRGSFRWHYYRLHGDGNQFTCYHCGRQFKSKRELADHIAVHGDAACFMCEICGKLYRGRHLLRAHLNTHTREDGCPRPDGSSSSWLACRVCSKKLSCQKALDDHVKLHQRTFQCQDCDKIFTSKKWLAKHRCSHKDKASYPCNFCDKVFTSPGTRKVHSLSHAGLKPYKCNVCGASFTQRTPMMMHWKKKHPGETELPPPVRLDNILRNINYRQPSTS